MSKERMTHPEAQAIAQELSQTTFDTLEELGHPIKAGQIDLDGKVITEERVEEARREIYDNFLSALRKTHTIIED
ncbi:MAG TPA: hypothetical protein VMX76_01605 [Nevskiaceae bacterium]|nr:hypothetical protein [Nevskiaceae bacterium]